MRYCKKCGRGMRDEESVCRFCGTFDPIISETSAKKKTLTMNAVSLALAAAILLPCAALYFDGEELILYRRTIVLALSCAFFAVKLLSLIICAAFWRAKRKTRKTLSDAYIVLTVAGAALNAAFWTPCIVLLFIFATMFLPTSLLFVTPLVLQIISCVMLARQVKRESECEWDFSEF